MTPAPAAALVTRHFLHGDALRARLPRAGGLPRPLPRGLLHLLQYLLVSDPLLYEPQPLLLELLPLELDDGDDLGLDPLLPLLGPPLLQPLVQLSLPLVNLLLELLYRQLDLLLLLLRRGSPAPRAGVIFLFGSIILCGLGVFILLLLFFFLFIRAIQNVFYKFSSWKNKLN